MVELIQDLQNTALNSNSEFRPLEDLERIFGQHDLFPLVQRLHRQGLVFEVKEELSEEERKKECQAMYRRGNHKSAMAEKEVVAALLAKDVQHGFSFPFLSDTALKVKLGMIQLCGRVSQFTLTEKGERVPKNRLTQDYTHDITKVNASKNHQIELEKYPPMIYGQALRRIIHFVVALRLKFPEEKILLNKADYSNAYRRVAHAPKTSAQSVFKNVT